jgi:hypothetical protein
MMEPPHSGGSVVTRILRLAAVLAVGLSGAAPVTAQVKKAIDYAQKRSQ